MLFKDILLNIETDLAPEFDRLLNLAFQNQTHDCDLLLIVMNGAYNEKMKNFSTPTIPKFSPYVIGDGNEGRSDEAHYKFIHTYRTQYLVNPTFEEYLILNNWSLERRAEIESLVETEELSIQLEMLIYLKIWEGDMFIKTLYEIVRLLKGERYNWHFKVKESNRDLNGVATRDVLIREHIRDEIKTFSEKIHDAIFNSYRTQIRNAIAHSNYAFLGRNIHLFNYIEGDMSHQLKCVTFDEWIKIFHNTIMIYNLLIKFKNKINKHYSDIALNKENRIEVRVTNDTNLEAFRFVTYRNDINVWNWWQNKI